VDPVILPCAALDIDLLFMCIMSCGYEMLYKEGVIPPAVGHIEAISAREQAIAIVPRKVMILLHQVPVSLFLHRRQKFIKTEDRLVVK
jgi:hypothetical protein